jgi:RNA-directed DNA polymerase
MAHIPMDKAILKQWLGAGFMDQAVLYPTEAGVAQGYVGGLTLASRRRS